jgi:hypothetical protein
MTFLEKKCLCVFTISSAFHYIVYKIEMHDKKFGINFIIATLLQLGCDYKIYSISFVFFFNV